MPMSKYLEVKLLVKIEIITDEEVDEREYKEAFTNAMHYNLNRSWGHETIIVACRSLARTAAIRVVGEPDCYDTFVVKDIEVL